ncbi:unnamed protein product [Arabidopsis halleri]
MEMMSLPRELIMDCIARVPRCYYPTLSLVSKMFRSIVASPELYARRTTNNCLVSVPLLPYMSALSSLAVVGSTIFVMGGCGSAYDQSVFLIDCPSNTWRLSGNMPRRLVSPKADILDGKIYVVGGEGRVLVFDTEKKMWEELETRSDMGKHCLCCVAMSGKIYIRTDKNSFVCEPKEGKWETDEILNSKSWKHACVIDNVLLPWKGVKEERFGIGLKQKQRLIWERRKFIIREE